MMKFHCYTASTIGNPKNCIFPSRITVEDEDSFIRAISFDHVTEEFKNNYRHADNYISSNCLPMDCDNDHSDDENDWVRPSDVALAFPGVSFYASYSRNHMKDKGSKSKRPRFHIYFPIQKIEDAEMYASYKKRLQSLFPYFDKNALGKARLLYGTKHTKVELYDGEKTIIDFLEGYQFEDKHTQNETIEEGSRNNTLSHFAGKVLKRYGNSDRAREAFLEKAGKCHPPMEMKELQSIWNSALKFFEKISKEESYISAAEFEQNAWDRPVPFEGEKMPEFPIEALPKIIRDYSVAVGKSTQTPVDMAAVGILTSVSACMRNLYKVEGKADWHEPTNIYSVIIAEPSERKSAVISLVTRPIDEYVKKYNRAHRVEFEMSRAIKQRLENKRNSLLSQRKRKAEDKGNEINEEIRKVVEEMVSFTEKKPLKIYVDDTTTEKLTESLAENENALAIISSEGGIFDVISGAYSNKVNIDVFLKAYSGENISVERIMRNSLFVENACLTILLSVQPVVIGELMKNKKFRHRGLTARFLYVAPQSFVGKRTLNAASISEESYKEYRKLIENILMEERGSSSTIIPLTEEAKALLSDYYDWVEQRLVGEFTMYSDWLGKLVGNTLRIAGILARSSVLKKDVEGSFFKEDDPIVIDRDVMANAIKIGKYFLIHAVNAYGDMGVRSDFKASLMALEKIKEKDIHTITRRDIMRFCRWIGNAEEAQGILDELEDYGYIRLSSIDPSDKVRGGRPKNAVYLVHPNLHEFCPK